MQQMVPRASLIRSEQVTTPCLDDHADGGTGPQTQGSDGGRDDRGDETGAAVDEDFDFGAVADDFGDATFENVLGADAGDGLAREQYDTLLVDVSG